MGQRCFSPGSPRGAYRGKVGQMTPEEVSEALKVKCEMCAADVGCECTSIIDGKPLRETGDRAVHFYRRSA